jgi:uncharacterized Tic20 family protein
MNDGTPQEQPDSPPNPEPGATPPPPHEHAPATEPQPPADAVPAEPWEREHAAWVHLGILSSLLGAPVVLSLVLWLMKREKSAFIDDHGKEAVNFQISMVLYSMGSVAVAWVVGLMTCGIGVVLAPLAWVAILIVSVVGVINGYQAANSGRVYRYPVTIRLVH